MTGVLLSALFVGRTLIEFFKEPQLGETPGLLNRGQLLSLPFIVAGVWLIVASIRRPQPAGWIVAAGALGDPHDEDDEEAD